jgi:DNA-binding MarR family transcriptional regulator
MLAGRVSWWVRDRCPRRRVPDLHRAKLTNQSVGYLVDYLEEHGYVERRPDPTNRRATLVCFTERGWDEADACAKILDQLDEQLTERMGTERLQQLQALLAGATAALQASKSAL